MNYIKKRLKEPSTWAGLAIVASQALSATGQPMAGIAAIAAGILAGLAAVLIPERNGAP